MSRPNKAERADIAVAEAAAPHRQLALVKTLGWVSELADQPPLIAICAATLAAGLVTRNRRLARAGARMLAAELLATKLKSFIKHRVDRTRPSVIADGGDYQAEPGHDPAHEMNSFPSGHTAGAVAVAMAYGEVYPEHRTAAYAAAAAAGVIQVPRCTHYPSDIGAGAVVGLVAARLVHHASSALLGADQEGDAPAPAPASGLT